MRKLGKCLLYMYMYEHKSEIIILQEKRHSLLFVLLKHILYKS